MKLGERGSAAVRLDGKGPIAAHRKPRKSAAVAARCAEMAPRCAVPVVEGVTVLNPGVAQLMRMRVENRRKDRKVQG